jgi:hypothetical protein
MRDISGLTAVQKQLLTEASDGSVIVGTLGKDPRSPNHRIFETSDGREIPRQTTVTSLLKRGLLKVVSVDGPRNYLTVTELGRLAVECRAARGSSARRPV